MVYHFQISALVLEIFKFEKWVKYVYEMTDNVIINNNNTTLFHYASHTQQNLVNDN